jgi:hypothetical protein
MKIVASCLLALLLSGMLLAQTGPATQDQPADPAQPAVVTAGQVQALQDALAAHQKQIDQQQQELEALRRQLAGHSALQVADASLHTSSSASTARAVVADAVPQEEGKPKESPLSFRIGGMDFTPGGFVDFENIFRTTNTGNASSTSFGSIPFSNTVQGHLTEYRATGQYSRFNLKVTGKYGANHITGYVEFDFNGNDPANAFVTSNSHTDRLRLYWLDLKRGKWEFLGGQTWGLLEPNRVGVSPMPSDLTLGYTEDGNTHVGPYYTRTAEFRVAYHFNDHVAWAGAIDNPQQYVGAGEVIFPFAFNAQLGPQLDAGNNPGTPNVAPDFATKVTYDNVFGGRNFHAEAGGLLTTVKVTNLPVGGTEFTSHSGVGGGIEAGLNFDLYRDAQGRNLRFVGSGVWGNGIGRYFTGLAPQAVIVPIQTGPATFTVDVSKVHSGGVFAGLEFLPWANTQLGVYYGGVYAQRNAFKDVTSPVLTTIPCHPGEVAPFHPCIGFGGPNSPNSANRAVQEATLDWTQTFWRNPQYGAVQLVTQWSYLTRAPWFVAVGAPKNAHLFMSYVSLRYVLP